MSADPKEWLAKAEADFHSANWGMQAPSPPGPNHDDTVFHCQQCIEKLMKGVLAAANVPFERTHELNTLAQMVEQTHPAWTWDSNALSMLQPGAVLLRYPGVSATRQAALDAIAACTKLRASRLPYY